MRQLILPRLKIAFIYRITLTEPFRLNYQSLNGAYKHALLYDIKSYWPYRMAHMCHVQYFIDQ